MQTEQTVRRRQPSRRQGTCRRLPERSPRKRDRPERYRASSPGEPCASGSGRYVGSTGHVPVGDVGIDVKPEPAEDGRPDDGDRHRNKTERREFADEGTAQKV